MWKETNIFGIFFPPLIAYMIVAAALYLPVRYCLRELGTLRWFWNPSLAEACIYISILGVLIILF
ncbi:MAG: DUF1656 domain-containing protein [Methylovirgula sp.]|uniref:DUF1656 domain-containing protein n=1 Tax=Methylovirgula sp. TaxID=1978224 RepID=UPI0030761D88